MNKTTVLVLIILSLPLVLANPYRATLNDMVSDKKVDLNYDTLTQSYHDDPTRYDIKVRVYSDTNIENKWLCLVYKVGNSFIEITEGPASLTRCEQLKKTDDYYETPDSIKIDDIRAKYPAILYAAMSDDKNIDLSDTFIKLNPETDGWLVGADGGPPCMGSAGVWVLLPEGCSIENTSDPVYDSFDITINSYQNEVGISVGAAYYPLSSASAAEIPPNNAQVAIGIGTSLDNILDSAITKLNNEVKLKFGSYTGKLNVYVNAIKEGEILVTAEGRAVDTGGSGGGAGPGQTKPEIWDYDTAEGKLKWVFPINYVESVTEVIIYLKTPVTSASLVLNSLDKSQISGKTYEYLNPVSSFNKENIASVHVKFKLPKEWLYNEFLLHDMIFLNYNKDGWKSTNTYILNEDLEYYYFISIMENLHEFAVGEKIGDLVPIPEQELSKVADEIKLSQEEKVGKIPIPNYLWIILLVIFILIVLFTRKKKKEHQK